MASWCTSVLLSVFPEMDKKNILGWIPEQTVLNTDLEGVEVNGRCHIAFVLLASDGATEEGNFLWMDGKKCPAREYLGRGALGGPKRRLVQLLLLRCASGRMQLARLPRYVDHVTKESSSDSSTSSRGGSQTCFCWFLQHTVMTTVVPGNVLPESSHVESVIKETTVHFFLVLSFYLILSQLSVFEVSVSGRPLIEVT